MLLKTGSSSGSNYNIPSAKGSGSTYYVATTGNDSNDGSSGSPWATPGKALATATTAGDVVVFEAGTYTADQSPWLDFSNSGTAAAPITWIARKAGSVIFDGNFYNFGLLIEEVDYITIQGIHFRNFAYAAVWSNSGGTTGTTNCTNIKLKRCSFANNGAAWRSPADQLGYVAVYTNGLSESWIIDECSFFYSGRPNNTDFDSETSGNNHTYRHDHHLYLEGIKHRVTNCFFFEAPTGYAVRVSGYWQDTLASGEYSVTVDNCKFIHRGNNSAYGDVHGWIGSYNNQTSHGTYGAQKEPKFEITDNVASSGLVGSGTDTFLGFFNDAQSYGSTTTEHFISRNSVGSAKVYNEGEAWLASHTGITATGNSVSQTLGDAELQAIEAEAFYKTGVNLRAIATKHKWTPNALPKAFQAGWWESDGYAYYSGTRSLSVVEDTSVVSEWKSLLYAAGSFTQTTAANRPDYVSNAIVPVDGTDSLKADSALDDLTADDFIIVMVASDVKGSGNQWLRITDYGGGNGFQFNHYSTSWYAYCHNTSNATSISWSSSGYTASTKIMMSFSCKAGELFQAFENGSLKGSMTPSAAWTSTESLLFGGGSSVGVDAFYTLIPIKGTCAEHIRQLAEGFAAWKHGLQSSLPSDHPWKTVKPYTSSTATTKEFTLADLPVSLQYGNWDFSDATSITLDGSNVETISNQFATTRDFTQATSGDRPLYNSTDGCIDYVGSKDLVYTGVDAGFLRDAEYTTFIVVAYAAIDWSYSFQYVMDTAPWTIAALGIYGGTHFFASGQVHDSGHASSAKAQILPATFGYTLGDKILMVHKQEKGETSGDITSLRLNGQLVDRVNGTPETNDVRELMIQDGATSGDKFFHAVIIPTTNEYWIQLVEARLAIDHGIPLHTDHPWYNKTPVIPT